MQDHHQRKSFFFETTTAIIGWESQKPHPFSWNKTKRKNFLSKERCALKIAHVTGHRTNLMQSGAKMYLREENFQTLDFVNDLKEQL